MRDEPSMWEHAMFGGELVLNCHHGLWAPVERLSSCCWDPRSLLTAASLAPFSSGGLGSKLGKKEPDKVKICALQSLQVSSEWPVVPRTKAHTKLQGQHLPAELEGWLGCWAPGSALRTGWARLSSEIPALSWQVASPACLTMVSVLCLLASPSEGLCIQVCTTRGCLVRVCKQGSP